MVKPDMDVIRQLSIPDRIALVEEIWNSISLEPGDVPVSEAQLAEARRRLADHDANPSTAIPWDAAEGRLRSKV